MRFHAFLQPWTPHERTRKSFVILLPLGGPRCQDASLALGTRHDRDNTVSDLLHALPFDLDLDLDMHDLSEMCILATHKHLKQNGASSATKST